MGPDAEVQSEPPHAETATKTELQLLTLVARHAATYGKQPVPLLGAEVDDRPASRIEDVATHRRAGAHAECRIGDVADRQFGRGLDVVRQNGRADRVAIRVVLNALDPRIGPGQLRTNVVRADANLERAGNPRDADVTADAVAVRPVRRLHDAVEEDRGRDTKDRIADGEAGGADAPAVRGAEVVVRRGAEVDAIVGVRVRASRRPAVTHSRLVPHASRVTDRRRDSRLGEGVGNNEVARTRANRNRILEHAAQRRVEREADVVVDESHHADVERTDARSEVEQPAARAEAECLIGDQHPGGAEIHDQLILADRELDVVGRRGRLAQIEEDRRAQNEIEELDGIEPRRIRIERRIMGQLVDRVLSEEAVETERDRNRDFGRAGTAATAVLYGAICGVIATRVAVPTQ